MIGALKNVIKVENEIIYSLLIFDQMIGALKKRHETLKND